MNYYLIDYENVKAEGLNGIEELTKEDVVHIFYSENADKLTFEMLNMIMKSQAKIIYQKVKVGHKNALDFQLTSYLGYLIGASGKEALCDYYIVSKDNGYAVLASFWNGKNIRVKAVSAISTQKREAAEQEFLRKLEAALGNPEDASAVAKIITSYKTKQGINNALQKKFPDRVKEIYRSIKPLITDKKGVRPEEG